MNTNTNKNLAIFASGTGSNALKIIEHLKGKSVNIYVFSNKKNAPVIEKARAQNVTATYFNRAEFQDSQQLLAHLKGLKIDLVVLAGFLWKIPDHIISAFPQQMINLHPSLLPKYGGKGMYGAKVHQAVLEAGEQKSGITIHYVNEYYDDGEILLQAETDITMGETPESLAQKIHHLEHHHLPVLVEKLLFQA